MLLLLLLFVVGGGHKVHPMQCTHIHTKKEAESLPLRSFSSVLVFLLLHDSMFLTSYKTSFPQMLKFQRFLHLHIFKRNIKKENIMKGEVDECPTSCQLQIRQFFGYM